jgi:phosphotransacetylase
MITRFGQLIERSQSTGPARAVIVHPHTDAGVRSALLVQERGLAQCTLLGDASKIRSLASDRGIDISSLACIDKPNVEKAIHQALLLCRQGQADVFVGADLPLRVLLPAILDRQFGLRSNGLVSGVSVCELQTARRLLIVSDGIMVVSPTFEQRIAIIENAVRVACTLGIALPHVALVAATETVNPKSSFSVDAAQITVMSRRKQIKDAVIDGPLGFDNAISAHAAQVKGIVSPVSGKVDVLIAPDMEAGNLLLRTLATLCQTPVIHVLSGGKAPVVLWSSEDSVQSRLAAMALGVCCV